jgi:hypothetical protein
MPQFLNDGNFRGGSKICFDMWSLLVIGVTSVQYFDSFCHANFMATNKPSFNGVFFWAKAHIMPSM